MRFRLPAFVAAVLGILLLISLAGCNNPWIQDLLKPWQRKTVSFDSGGGSAVAEQDVENGKTASKPTDPTKMMDAEAGLYLGTPEGFEYTFIGWFLDGSLYDFNTPVTEDITLVAQWGESENTPSLIPYDVVPANYVNVALDYVNLNANTYTLLIDKDAISGTHTLSPNVNLSIVGKGAPRIIQYNDDLGLSLFTLNDSSQSLTLGNNITLYGKNTCSVPLVQVDAGTLTMKAGSKITGHTNSSNSGAVYVHGGSFVMEGGEISGNHNPVSNQFATGGIKADGGRVEIRGGTVKGNTGHYGADNNPADIFLEEGSQFFLSGDAAIGALTLYATSYEDDRRASITIDRAYTGSATINLSYNGHIEDVIPIWENAHIIKGSPTATDIGRFTLGRFICDNAAENCSIGSNEFGNFRIGNTDADIGKLLKSVAVTGVLLDKNEMTLSAGNSDELNPTLTPSNATTPLSWTSSDLSVAKVVNGTVTAVAHGTAIITASANGASDSCIVTVFEGSGSLTDPFLIYDETDLLRVGTGTAGWTLSSNYKVMKSFAITKTKSWKPIGIDYDHPFNGNFDGNGFSITGLKITNATSGYQGLFGSINGGVVENLNLSVSINIAGDFEKVGGIAGYAHNDAKIVNCSVSGSVSGYNKVGGVVGENSNSRVQNCSVSGSVSGTNVSGSAINANNDVGGVVGQLTVNGTVQNCSATGNVSGNYHIGGVVGQIINGTVQNCYATGNVSGNEFIGGVVGDNSYGTVQYCFATGDVSGNVGIGGVVGDNSDTVNNCVALNANIAATGASFGRVAGNDGTKLTNNYARIDMRNKDGNPNNWIPNGNNTKNGENITSTQWGFQSWWSDTTIGPGFDFDEASDGAWDWPTGKFLPILRGIPESVQNPKVID